MISFLLIWTGVLRSKHSHPWLRNVFQNPHWYFKDILSNFYILLSGSFAYSYATKLGAKFKIQTTYHSPLLILFLARGCICLQETANFLMCRGWAIASHSSHSCRSNPKRERLLIYVIINSFLPTFQIFKYIIVSK